MYDSTVVAAIPSTATLILVYVDGNYQTEAAARARFPNAQLVTCTTTYVGQPGARIYDCERGDGNAVSAVQWAQRELSDSRRPTIYCSRIGTPGYGWPDVLAQLDAQGIAHAAVDFGIADYTNTPHLLPGSVFTQYANPPLSGGNYDISLTNGIWPNVLPLPIKEETMSLAIKPDGTVVISAVGANARADHLLVFTLDPTNPTKPGYNVLDVTDGIGGADPYTVQSA